MAAKTKTPAVKKGQRWTERNGTREVEVLRTMRPRDEGQEPTVLVQTVGGKRPPTIIKASTFPRRFILTFPRPFTLAS